MIEILKDNGRPEVGAVYGAIDMDWAKLVGQIAQANAKVSAKVSVKVSAKVSAKVSCAPIA